MSCKSHARTQDRLHSDVFSFPYKVSICEFTIENNLSLPASHERKLIVHIMNFGRKFPFIDKDVPYLFDVCSCLQMYAIRAELGRFRQF